MSIWNDKTIWITGATSGIGLELARQFAASGANLVLSARREAELNRIAGELPGDHRVVVLDLADPDAVLQTATAVLPDLPPIDVLINNGGISQRARFLDTELSVFQRLNNVNYLSVVALTKAVVPGMIARGHGSIVVISSVAGIVGPPLRTGYSGSKYAVRGFVDALRSEIEHRGVQCLTVCPGFVKTSIADNALAADGSKAGQVDPEIENGMPVDECCRQILKAIESGKAEVVIGTGISGMAPTIKRFAPGLLRKIMSKRGAEQAAD